MWPGLLQKCAWLRSLVADGDVESNPGPSPRHRTRSPSRADSQWSKATTNPNGRSRSKSISRSRSRSRSPKRPAKSCFNCGDRGHLIRNCPLALYCEYCDTRGHCTRFCRANPNRWQSKRPHRQEREKRVPEPKFRVKFPVRDSYDPPSYDAPAVGALHPPLEPNLAKSASTDVGPSAPAVHLHTQGRYEITLKLV